MKRKLRNIFLTLLLLIAAGMALFLALYHFTPVVDHTVLRLINHYSGENLRVTYEELSGNLYRTIRLKNPRLFMTTDTIRADGIDITYSLLDVLRGRYVLDDLQLNHPSVTWHLGEGAAVDSSSTPLDSLIINFHLAEWPRVKIGRLDISDGQLRLISPQQEMNISDVNTRLSAEMMPGRLYLAPEYLRGFWQEGEIRLNQLAFTLEGDDRVLDLAGLMINVNDIPLSGRGQLLLKPAVSWSFMLDSVQTTVTQFQQLGGSLPYNSGFLQLSGAANGNLHEVQGQLEGRGQLDKVAIRRLKGRFNIGESGITVDELDIASSAGSLAGGITVSGSGDNAVNARFNGIDLQPLGFSETTTRLNGHIQARFSGDALKTLNGRGSLTLTNLVYAPYRIDALQLNIAAANGNLTIREPSRLVVGPNSTFQLSGSFSRDQVLDISLVTDRNNLDTLAQRLALSGIGGSGSMELQLTGRVEDPSMIGTIYLDSLTYDRTVIYGIDGNLDIKNIAGNRQGSFDLELATGYIGNVFLTSGVVQFRFDGNRITFDPFRFYSEENSIQTTGVLDYAEGLISLSLSDFRLSYERYDISNQQPLVVRLFNQDSLVIDQLTLIGGNTGSIDAKGHLDISGHKKSELLVQLQNIQLAPFNEYLYWNRQMRGLVNADLDLYGQLANPDIDLRVSIEEFSIDENDLGRASGDFTVSDRRLSINVISIEGKNNFYFDINGNVDIYLGENVADSDLEIARDIPLGLNIIFGNLRLEDYDFLYETTRPVAGALTGRLDLGGSWLKPQATLSLQGKQIKYGDYEFPQLDMDLNMQPDNLVINNANINFLDTDIKAHGSKRLRWNPDQLDSLFADKYMELYFDINEDSLNFLNAINDQLERLVGKVILKGALKGDYDNLQFETLTASVSEGRLYLTTLENSIDQINTRASLNGNRLTIDAFTAKSPKPKRSRNFIARWFSEVRSWFFPEPVRGDIRGEGWIDLSELDRPRVNLSLSMDNAYFNYFIENTEVVVNSKNIRVAGRDTILVRGDITVAEGEVEFNFVESEKNLLFETYVRETPPFVIYNLNIELLNNFSVRSYETLNSFDMNIDGQLRVLSQPRGELEMYGTLNTSGNYFVQGESFDIQNGKIEFVNPKELPELNLTARTFKRDAIRDQQLTFLLNVTGKIDTPTKEIVITDDKGNVLQYEVKDQLSLLLFGVTFDQLSGSDAQELILSRGEQVITQVLISSIEREARTFTGLDKIQLNQQDSFFSNRLNRPSTLSLGKYLTPNLYLEYRSQLTQTGLGNVPSPQLSWEAGNQIYLQYRLNRSWSFSTIYQKTQEGNDKVQFDINWQTSF